MMTTSKYSWSSWLRRPSLTFYISLSNIFVILVVLQHPGLIYGGDNNYNDQVNAIITDCEHHNNIQELIKTSPVILKALGANIFADDDENFISIHQHSHNPQETTANNNNNKRDQQTIADSNSRQQIRIPSSFTMDDGSNRQRQPDQNFDENFDENEKVFWITLTPETIYKGASLLKVARTQTTAPVAPDTVAGRILGESYRYEGQLNATLEPFGCFDKEALNLLPTELIVFGKLISNIGEQQHQHHQSINNVLRISVNGLHRWTPKFESRIWKYLGWADWSDFTLCSVSCGKGVQQRFRRCLLDSPSTTTPFPPPPPPPRHIDSNSDFEIDDSSPHQKQYEIKNQMLSVEHQADDDDFADDPDARIIYGQRQQHYNHQYRSWRTPQSPTNPDDNNQKHTANTNHKKPTNNKLTNKQQRWKKKRKTKGLTTLSCEGYNIEQRNCNMFECADDISDLLKFYKRTLVNVNETNLTATGTPFALKNSGAATVTTVMMVPPTTSIGSLPTFLNNNESTSTTTTSAVLRNWQNHANFTLMITLRAKTPPTQSTIFSVRNLTHNLYLDQSENGLKFFQERDEVTEMLPIKFDLYDNRWHQIAISVRNGDFIMVYVDCLWTNSFVVSKRLFALPDGADVEIGHEFNGELQQLSILPGNHEKQQCSTIRTSINEVKRYIIDTFIDDYAN